MKLKTFYFNLSIIMVFVNLSIGQQSLLSTFKNDFYQSLTVGKNLGREIVKPTKDKIGLTLGILSLSLADETVIDFFRDNQSALNDKIFNIDRIHGEKNILFPAAIALYAYGLFARNASIRQLGLKSGQAMFYSGLIIVTLKEIFGRSRPYQQNGAFKFKPFSFQEGWRSFPSGHAGLSFAFSTVMASSMDVFWWKVFWYSGAALVASARMYHDKHWLSDVLAGGLIGWSVARFVWHSQDEGDVGNAYRISPFFKPGVNKMVGLSVLFKLN